MLNYELDEFSVYQESIVEQDGTTLFIVKENDTGEKRLAVVGGDSGFVGIRHESSSPLICPLSPENARVLRQRLPWLRPVPLGLKTSVGFGDRLGVATPGHIRAARGAQIAPIFAQQSVRENTRIGRTPQQVMDDAMWGVFQSGWREPWGADADHMKVVGDIDPFIDAGYTFFTIDPGEHVDNEADTADDSTLRARVQALPWTELDSSPDALRQQLSKTFQLDGLTLEFDEHTILKAAAKYCGAVAHTVRMARYLRSRKADADLEMSVDETDTTTTWHEHFYIASELRRLGISWTSLAPRFVGRFEKGVDYIGDLHELEENIAGHAAIMRFFGNSYKLSLHTGSDKFGVYPLALKHTGGWVHMKTAGTSYLEALRVMAVVEPALFREVLDFSRGRFEHDRKTYYISAQLDKVPASAALSDADLPDLLNQFDARQVLHVTFGSVLDTYGKQLQAMLRAYEDQYIAAVKAHFDRHLESFAQVNHAG
jgi:tagaturonate epimerase